MRKIFALATITLLAACGTASPARISSDGAKTTTATAYGPEVVHLQGLQDVRFGDTRTALKDRLNETVSGCSAQLNGVPQGSLVFAADSRLVLLWFQSPLRTPEGVTTGSDLSAVKAAYPDAKELKAPAGSYRFDGLLVTVGDRGYLFLHDGAVVQKAIAGYTEYLDRLFSSGFGSC